jgi:hypothetical protein
VHAVKCETRPLLFLDLGADSVSVHPESGDDGGKAGHREQSDSLPGGDVSDPLQILLNLLVFRFHPHLGLGL